MLMKELLDIIPQTGSIDWIGIRPKKKADLVVCSEIQVHPEWGIKGDHYSGTSGKRHLTLIQGEHLEVVRKILMMDHLDPGLLRRNIVVRGINLLALHKRKVRIGTEVIIEITGHCHPCTRMEQNLGPGGYNTMRGHGGLTARIVRQGTIRLGDNVGLFKDELS